MAPATVVQGNPTELECEISDMNGEVTWLKDGKPLALDERIRAQNGSGGVRLLTIEGAQFDDAAEYTCKFADLTTKAKLTVTGENVAAIVVIYGLYKLQLAAAVKGYCVEWQNRARCGGPE